MSDSKTAEVGEKRSRQAVENVQSTKEESPTKKLKSEKNLEEPLHEKNWYGWYLNVCTKLELKEAIVKKGWEVLSQLKLVPAEGKEDLFKRSMIACTLYLISCGDSEGSGSEKESRNTILLTDLVNATNIRHSDFFEAMRQFIDDNALGKTYMDQLKFLERQFMRVFILYQKYVKEMKRFFILDSSPMRKQIFQMGWLLFLMAKKHIIPDSLDVVTPYYLLLCCITTVVSNTHECNLQTYVNAMYQEKPNLGKIDTKHVNKSNTLKIFCYCSGADYNCIGPMFGDKYVEFLQILNDRVLSPVIASMNATSSNDNLFGRILTDSTSLQNCLSKLNQEYNTMYHANGFFDERSFWEPQQRSEQMPPTTPISTTTGYVNTIRQTPISAGIKKLNWINSITQGCTDTPTPHLLHIFAQVKENPQNTITQRLDDVLSKIDLRMEGSVHSQKEIVTKKLYYKILTDLLAAEKKKLPSIDFTVLLHNDSFNRCLIGVCVEIVLFSFNFLSHLRFPYILTIIDIEAFDFWKMIEGVLRFLSIPSDIKGYLVHIEEFILESLAWKTDQSPVYRLLMDNPARRKQLLDYIQTRKTPQTARGNPIFSPLRPQRAAVNAGSRTLFVFYKRLFSMASVRCRILAGELDMKPKLFSEIWRCMELLLVNHSYLLIGRHLDQLIFCVIYGVWKLHENTDSGILSFGQIRDVYVNQRFARSKIYRNILLENGERGNIVAFYNRVFVPKAMGVLTSVKEEFLRVIHVSSPRLSTPSKNRLGLPSGAYYENSPYPKSPAPSYQRSRVVFSPMLSKQRVPEGMTYIPGKSPVTVLREINQTVTRQKSKSAKKLDFDDDTNADEEMTNPSGEDQVVSRTVFFEQVANAGASPSIVKSRDTSGK